MLEIKNVTVNYLKNPLGTNEDPQFGWIIESDRQNVMQKSYRLQIAYDPDFLHIAYDSMELAGSQSAHIQAGGFAVKSTTKYYVRVRIKDGVEESPWSGTVSFETALLGYKEWAGRFISAETELDAENSKGTCVRKCFTAKQGISRARVYCTALGLYRLYINGKKVGDDELTPGWTSYHKHLLYQTYDITGMVRPGENAAGAMLGAGWYKGLMGFAGLRNHYGKQTAFLFQIEITYNDGSKEMVVTDETWKGADSPILFSEIYDGEIYDARKYEDGWNLPGFDDSGWSPVNTVEYDKSVLTAQAGCKVQEIERIPVKKLITTPEGDTVIDFGQNLTGWVEFKVQGKPGDRVELNHFEVLDSKGNAYFKNLRTARQTDIYTLKGGSVEVLHPHFTFHGFQYVKIAEYPGKIKAENFEAVVLHSRMEQTGTFECSNPYLNQLQHNILWGLKGNFVDIPSDCPQRNERLGWTGDAQIFCRTASYLMNTYTFFSKWLADVSADQTPEGGVPHVVPDIVSGKTENDWLLSKGTHSAAAWADVAVILPWTLYLTYGDTRILKRQYSGMKAWIDFMHSHSENGIWNYKLQFGDWVALDAKEGSYFGATPNDLTCSAFYAYSTHLFSKAAKVLGNEDDYKKYDSLYKDIVKTFRRTFFTPSGTLTARTQTAHILVLYFNLVPEKYREKTTKTLLELLDENNGHLVTGFVGTPYFCHALSQNGCTKEAYDLLLKDDFPSWLYQVKAGATTVWEHWDGRKPDGSMWSPDMNSFNHYAYGAIGEWLYRVVAGIEIDENEPGYRHSIISPQIGGGLSYVKAEYKSIYGSLSVSWKVTGNRVELNVTIPHNTTSTISLCQAVKITNQPSALFSKNENGYAARFGSGRYKICYTI